MDKDLNGFRNARWEKAFGARTDLEEAQKDSVDRKATIVIEFLIQASDVSHTMQHWHVFRKWNGRCKLCLPVGLFASLPLITDAVLN